MKQRVTTARKSGKRFKLITEIISELRKVVWLTRREAIYLTTLVVIVAICTGIALGLIDFGFTRLVPQV